MIRIDLAQMAFAPELSGVEHALAEESRCYAEWESAAKRLEVAEHVLAVARDKTYKARVAP